MRRVMRRVLFLIFTLSLNTTIFISLFCMPEATEASASEMPTSDTSAMPTADTSTAMPAAMPTTSDAQAQPATSTEEVKPEQLGEFEIKEDQIDVLKSKDPNIGNLSKKVSALSKEISDLTDEVQKIRDTFFDKFSNINEKLDGFYQKIGIESGEAQAFLKEQK